jgi:dihydroorotase-like cyclic amidohydrolase
MGKDLGIPIQRIASAFSEKPAEIFGIVERGRLCPGQIADIVILDPNQKFTVGNPGDFHKSGSASISCKCGWSPYEGTELSYAVKAVFLNGKPVATTSEPDADDAPRGRALSFE